MEAMSRWSRSRASVTRGGEGEEGLAVEVLELVECDDGAGFAQGADARGQRAQVGGQVGVDAEHAHEVAGGADHPGGIRVGDLDVEDAVASQGR